MYVLKCPKNFTMKLSYNFIKITHKHKKEKKTKGGVAAKYSFFIKREVDFFFRLVLFIHFHIKPIRFGLHAVDYDFK